MGMQRQTEKNPYLEGRKIVRKECEWNIYEFLLEDPTVVKVESVGKLHELSSHGIGVGHGSPRTN
jgi:hypothetical protein